ncbi:hypothetical protein GIB67_018188 [Kingdonia uniflora]|uniref:Guanylate kinase 1 n=1 Tax=Kingdonia uniflora TaxID=39325 RepID=A0A7J7NN42_9MAGN|nr:hypothetical protein GIB67_018188 [Kingdonia uniflora]
MEVNFLNCKNQGEIQGVFEDEMKEKEQNSITIGRKIYVVGGSDGGATLSIGVQIFDTLTGIWEVPVILGTKPAICKCQSSVLLNQDRILMVKKDSVRDDCIWFLEVDTPFTQEQKKLLQTEVVAWSKGVKGVGPQPVIISGPSGVGKGTLISKLMNEFPSMFGFSVSHTTRAPREKEKHGIHYHFTERSVMEKDIRDGKFLESAFVHGNIYGTSIEAVELVTDAGKRCILDIDVQGARSVRASSLEAKFIFICPPSFEELEKRLRARGTETEEQVQKRLRNARAELNDGKSSGLFDHILVNDDLNTCYENLKKLLDLDGSTDSTYQSPSEVSELPGVLSMLKADRKFLINYGTNDVQKGSNNSFVLDVSSLKGGAPGRTRGLNIYAVDPFEENLYGLNQI